MSLSLKHSRRRFLDLFLYSDLSEIVEDYLAQLDHTQRLTNALTPLKLPEIGIVTVDVFVDGGFWKRVMKDLTPVDELPLASGDAFNMPKFSTMFNYGVCGFPRSAEIDIIQVEMLQTHISLTKLEVMQVDFYVLDIPKGKEKLFFKWLRKDYFKNFNTCKPFELAMNFQN